MAKKLHELIRELSVKAGMKQDDQELTTFLSNDFLDRVVPDSVFNGLNTSLLSVESATNNHQSIKSHYFKAAYDGLDKTIRETMDELELSDEIKAEVMKESSSTRRAALLAKKIREIERAAKKDGDKTPAELTELRDSVNKLNAKVAEKESALAKQKEKYEKQIKEINKNTKLSTLVSKYQTILDAADPEIKMATIMAAINRELSASDGLLDLDDAGAWSLKKKDGTNFHNENHVLVTPDQFIESALSKNNILSKNNSAQRPGQNNQNNFQNPGGQNNSRSGNDADDKNRRINSRAASIIDQTLEQLERGASGARMI